MKAKVVGLLLLSVCLISSVVFSEKKDKRKFIPGCQELGFEFSDGNLVLTPVKSEEYDQTIYFIHNVSGTALKMKYTKNLHDFHPLWEAKMDANNWAVFATDKKDLTFSCQSEYYSEDSSDTDCTTAVEVCQFPRAKFAAHNRGNYWVTSNKAKYSARRAAIKAGILLRW